MPWRAEPYLSGGPDTGRAPSPSECLAPAADEVAWKRRSKLLVAYSMASSHVQATMDYLEAIRTHSGFEVSYLHVTHDARLDVDFDDYDVVFHNFCARLCYPDYVSDDYRRALRAFGGLKVLAVQDEYDLTNVLKAAIADLGFDIVLTCVPPDSLEYVYPRSEFPAVKFITVLTGYVSDSLASAGRAARPVGERPVTLGYRGRDMGPMHGRLGHGKYEIGRRMREECQRRGVACDIAMDEASRIYGPAWLEFVGSCRAMLGSESGSNVFDFDGSIAARYHEMTRALGGCPPTYTQFRHVVDRRDCEISMGQISPRVFECAAMRTPMVLSRGRYSDAVAADEHYIPLELDFSNIDEVFRRLEDLRALEEMADRAHAHLIASGSFSYAAFWRDLSETIQDARRSRQRPPPSTTPRRHLGSPSLVEDEILRERPSAFPLPPAQVFTVKQAAIWRWRAGRRFRLGPRAMKTLYWIAVRTSVWASRRTLAAIARLEALVGPDASTLAEGRQARAALVAAVEHVSRPAALAPIPPKLSTAATAWLEVGVLACAHERLALALEPTQVRLASALSQLVLAAPSLSQQMAICRLKLAVTSLRTLARLPRLARSSLGRLRRWS